MARVPGCEDAVEGRQDLPVESGVSVICSVMVLFDTLRGPRQYVRKTCVYDARARYPRHTWDQFASVSLQGVACRCTAIPLTSPTRCSQGWEKGNENVRRGGLLRTLLADVQRMSPTTRCGPESPNRGDTRMEMVPFLGRISARYLKLSPKET